jgi:hypothetical protein
MRKISELLEIVLEELKSNDSHSGLCSVVSTCWYMDLFTGEERIILDCYLINCKPKLRIWIRKKVYKSNYWWKQWDKAPRIEWLEKRIEKEKRNEERS